MAKDRFLSRFLKKKQKSDMRERARENLPPEVLDEEDEILANTPKVDPIKAEREPGRNDPCPCGSGRKFKKCCGKEA